MVASTTAPARQAARTAQAHSTSTATQPDPMAGFVAPPVVLQRTARCLADHPAYAVRGEQGWIHTSWADYGQAVRDAARALMTLGVSRGDAVAVLSFNCPQWAVAGFGAMSVGAIPAGIYWTSSQADVAYILGHCKAPVLFIEDATRLHAIEPVLAEATHLRHLVVFKGDAPAQCAGKPVHTWAAFRAMADATWRRAFAAVESADEFAARWPRVASRIGIRSRDRIDVIADGARWIWDRVSTRSGCIMNRFSILNSMGPRCTECSPAVTRRLRMSSIRLSLLPWVRVTP